MSNGASRREFLRIASLAGASVGLSGLASPMLRPARGHEEPTRKLKILVLGGTGQTGPHLIREALDRGHTVTMFNRGNRSEELFPDVECLIGDRYPERGEGLSSLEKEVEAGREWDVVMDVWPHIPRLVEATVVLVAELVDVRHQHLAILDGDDVLLDERNLRRARVHRTVERPALLVEASWLVPALLVICVRPALPLAAQG